MAKLGEKSQSSSTTSPSEERELSICFCGTTIGRDRLTEWYVFNISNNDFKYKKEKVPRIKRHRIDDNIRCVLEERNCVEDHHHRGDGIYGMRKLTPVSQKQRYVQHTCVALGSTIFVLGHELGTKHETILCLDLNNPGTGWKKVTPMIASRSNSQLVVVDGKLYAICGSHTDGCCEPWAEVYDPRSGEWEPLPGSPSRIFIAQLIALDAPNRIAVIDSCSDLYVYDVAAKSWEEVNSHLSLLKDEKITNVVVVGHKLYWYTNLTRKGEICAYDLDQGMWFLGHIQGLESDYNSLKHNHPRFLHLGGDKFCLLWVDLVPECDSDSDDMLHNRLDLSYSQLHCVKLKVSISTRDKYESYYFLASISSLSVTVESCQSYFIDQGISFIDALLLDGRLGKEGQLDKESAIGRDVVKVA